MNKDKFLNKIKYTIQSIDPDATIILFGSRARGDSKTLSDWDFLILTNEKVNELFKNKIRDELFETELETDEIISSIIHNKDYWENLKITPLYKNIAREGIKI